MKRPRLSAALRAVLPALAALAAPAASAQLMLDATVLPLGGSFRYDFTVTNPGPDEYVLVTIDDAPTGDALITATLAAPAGFLGLYDDALGLVDFLEDGSFFTAGSLTGGFGFESLAGPDLFFTGFTALTTTGDPFSGRINVTVVPEPGAVAAGAGLALLAAWAARRRLAAR
jgi:hypothetical protein